MLESPEYKLQNWLTRNNATRLWRCQSDPLCRVEGYAVNGHVIIAQVWDNGGFDLFASICSANNVQETLKEATILIETPAGDSVLEYKRNR
jgi:hypothetical protein